MIFGQSKLAAGESLDLYTADGGVYGTLYIAAEVGYDIVSVQLVPANLAGVPVAVLSTDPSTYILRSCGLVGNTPMYLQEIYLNTGDVLRVSSEYGDCAFTFTGDYF